MHSASRLKLAMSCFSLFVLLVGLALFGSTRVTTHAASTPSEFSLKLRTQPAPSVTKCGSWSVVSSATVMSSYIDLNSVAAVSANNIWAVGYYYSIRTAYALILGRDKLKHGC